MRPQSIAQTVKSTPAENATSSFSSGTPSMRPTTAGGSTLSTPPSSEMNWLDDPETQKFLQSLGLAGTTATNTGIVPATSNAPTDAGPLSLFQPAFTYDASWDPMNNFANNFSIGLDALEGTSLH